MFGTIAYLLGSSIRQGIPLLFGATGEILTEKGGHLNLGIPGVKMGLANIVTMVMLYCVGWKAAVLISLARILLSGILFGSGFAMVYSAAGAALRRMPAKVQGSCCQCHILKEMPPFSILNHQTMLNTMQRECFRYQDISIDCRWISASLRHFHANP